MQACPHIPAGSGFAPPHYPLTITALTHAAHQHFDLLGHKTPGELYRRDRYIFQAKSIAAGITDEMHMIITVLSTGTVVFTQRITYRIIRSRDAMDKSFLQEGLERPVDGDAVEGPACPFFDIAVRQGTFMPDKIFQYLPSSRSDAQLIFF
jgi:hypothetical protein